MPGAEAMAAGCYVVGFTGDGAKEYLTPDVASVILDSDVVGMCDATLAAMAAFETDRAAWQGRVDLGRARVLEKHSSTAVRAALEATFAQLDAPGSPARLAAPATVQHYMAHGPRGGRAGAAYVQARKLARRSLDRFTTHEQAVQSAVSRVWTCDGGVRPPLGLSICLTKPSRRPTRQHIWKTDH